MYTIGDFLIQLKNAYLAHKQIATLPYSKENLSIGKILQEEGFLKSVKEVDVDRKKRIQVELLYKNRLPAMSNIKIVSRPSVQYFAKKNDAQTGRSRYGVTILSTSQGVMTNKKAHEKGVGGKVICRVY